MKNPGVTFKHPSREGEACGRAGGGQEGFQMNVGALARVPGRKGGRQTETERRDSETDSERLEWVRPRFFARFMLSVC